MGVSDDSIEDIVVIALIGGFEIGAILVDENKDEIKGFAGVILRNISDEVLEFMDEAVFDRGESLVGAFVMTVKSGGFEMGGVTNIFNFKGDSATPKEGIKGGFDFAFAFLVTSVEFVGLFVFV